MKEVTLISFISTHLALASEELLLSFSLPFTVIPTPKEISSTCGITLSISRDNKKKASILLKGKEALFTDALYKDGKLLFANKE